MTSVGPNKMVTLRYAMRSRFPDGTVKERSAESFSFVYGAEPQVPTLERTILGRRAGEKVSVLVPAAEIYGEHDPSLIVEIPKQGLIKQRLKQGRFYRQMRMGSLVSFKVLEIRPGTVLADFNKPLVGIEVSMEVEILDVRDASEEEVQASAEAARRRDMGCG